MKKKLALLLTVASTFAVRHAGAATKATAELVGIDGVGHGTITLVETENGVLIEGQLHDLPPGEHAIHLHAKGICQAPFTSAGDHVNPTARRHGFKSAHGPHAGDLPNIIADEDGKARFEMLATKVSLSQKRSLFDQDGTSVIVHAKADDHRSDPSGGSGDRIACGVVKKLGEGESRTK
jgi:Cu-Zn family superoxide dismutase